MEKKTWYCKSCFEKIKLSPIRSIFETEPILCDKCISSIKTKLSFKKNDGILIMFLSEYDGIEKQWLMHFKEYGDVELAQCFLFSFLPLVRLYGWNSIFVPVPSREERIKQRGFDHLSKILKGSRLNYLNCLKMEDEGEQKNSKAKDRGKKKRISLSVNPKVLQGKNIVLFDDVYTSGTTFSSAVSALKKQGINSIRGLILMNNSDRHQSGL